MSDDSRKCENCAAVEGSSMNSVSSKPDLRDENNNVRSSASVEGDKDGKEKQQSSSSVKMAVITTELDKINDNVNEQGDVDDKNIKNNSVLVESTTTTKLLTKLFRCSRCKSAWYCSKKCQVADWKRSHQYICRLPGIGGMGQQAEPVPETEYNEAHEMLANLNLGDQPAIRTDADQYYEQCVRSEVLRKNERKKRRERRSVNKKQAVKTVPDSAAKHSTASTTVQPVAVQSQAAGESTTAANCNTSSTNAKCNADGSIIYGVSSEKIGNCVFDNSGKKQLLDDNSCDGNDSTTDNKHGAGVSDSKGVSDSTKSAVLTDDVLDGVLEAGFPTDSSSDNSEDDCSSTSSSGLPSPGGDLLPFTVSDDDSFTLDDPVATEAEAKKNGGG